jgi:hypothetical protein
MVDTLSSLVPSYCREFNPLSMPYRFKILLFPVVIGSFSVVPLLGILLQQEADIVDSMPTGEWKRTVVRICSECHSLENVVSQKNTVSGWESIIDEMTLRGAQIFADDRKMVVAYLDKYYGLDRSEREALMEARYGCLF